MIALPFRKLFGCKFVFDHHDPFPELFAAKFPNHRWLHKLTLFFERMALRSADMVITTSLALRNIAIQRAGVAPEMVHLVRTCPDLQAMRRVAPDPGLRKGASIVVAYLGIMGPQDGVDILLRAARETIHTHRRVDVRFLLIGDGPELKNLRQLARDLEIEPYVTFTGFLGGESLLTALSSADLGACPDPSNPLNDKLAMIKVMEYMAMGLPSVMFDLSEARTIAGDASEYVAGDNGHQALAAGILGLVDDPERRQHIGAYGRERAEVMFDWNAQRRIYLSAYSGLEQ
jgi:glycosyltransferase involved in cell wall biosynthesis